ncbi:MAG: monovalent cation/H+ antiporter subunit D family protein [Planctomycetes bacterium]|nr:monovalent cation/H+ antiporter subunit D family protein [Planctomycetota bacterium]
METYGSWVPVWAVACSLAASGMILASSRRPNLREFWTLSAAGVKFALILTLVPEALAHRVAEARLFAIAPGIDLTLRADPLGVFFALVSSALWIVTSCYSVGYMRGLSEHKQTRYFACFAVCLSSTVGIAFAANLLTFVIFYEMLTIATYPLVIHKETPEAVSAGRKYLAYTLTAGVVLLVATAWTYELTGTLEFRPGGFLGSETAPAATCVWLFVLFMSGAAVKSALMPLHGWLPTAMIAPTPVSALLHAVAVVKAGVFAVIRIVGFVFGPATLSALGLQTYLACLAGLTMILASVLAFHQDNLKRRLAYSTIGHLSYIVLGAALLTPASLAGSLLHLASHATMKITLFFCAGALHVQLHKEKISELDGVARQMPWTMGAFAVASLGLAGLPPLNGFVSKWYLGLGALQAAQPLAFALFLLAGLLSAGYFLPILYRAFCRAPQPEAEPSQTPHQEGDSGHDASAWITFPLLITAALSLILGLFPNLLFHFWSLAHLVSDSILNGGSP